jgi:putative hydroxymethylpyrimidine transport system permease protein
VSAPLRALITLGGLVLAWQALVWLTDVPPYILPGPVAVAVSWLTHTETILPNALVTLSEILAGLVLGTALGCLSALTMSYFRPARRWLLPLLVVSQAVPVFAIAPLLVLWLGYGMGSKVAMATLIIYFPVTASLFDGLRRTEPGWLDLAHAMTAGGSGARWGARWAVLRHIRLPAALPALASGLRVAAAVAPIGAVVGEWVGSSAGLGYMMLHANGRMQTDLMFAALLTLALLAVALYFSLDAALRRLLFWQRESLPDDDPHPATSE